MHGEPNTNRNAGHPLDTIKTRLITVSSKYSGMGDCFRKILAEEGIRGLYAGAASPLMGAVAMNAVVFFSYGGSKKVSVGSKGKKRNGLARFYFVQVHSRS